MTKKTPCDIVKLTDQCLVQIEFEKLAPATNEKKYRDLQRLHSELETLEHSLKWDVCIK